MTECQLGSAGRINSDPKNSLLYAPCNREKKFGKYGSGMFCRLEILKLK